MKKRYFIKRFAAFLVPLLFPLATLGTLSFFTTQNAMKSDINQSSQFLLQQSQQQIDMILSELDTLKLALYQNAKVFNELSAIVQHPKFTYETLASYQVITSYLNALTSSKPYIHSVFVYVDNPYRQYLSSLDGLARIPESRDTKWFDEFMAYEGPPVEWTSRRAVNPYDFELAPTEYVTISNIIYPRQIGIFLNIRPSYIRNVLQNATAYEAQELFILDEKNNVIFSNTKEWKLQDTELDRIVRHEASHFEMNASMGKVAVTRVESNAYKWKYVSIIPLESLYKTPSRILFYTIVFAGISFVGGLLLTYYLTRRNYRHLLTITALIRSAENNPLLLKPPRKVKDEYTFILQNMIRHFIEHRYVKTQLSEKKYRLQVVELLALQAQINPHFLYNTLNSIYWETVGLTGRPNQASEMIENLSDMLSYSIGHAGNKVTWEDEIANAVSYLNIEKVRYADKFDYYFEYDSEIQGMPAMKLLLQPIVENSVKHGMNGKAGPGLIKIKIAQRQDKFRIAIIDNGAGIPRDRLAEIRRSMRSAEERQGHIGLSNTNKRLSLMYDDNYEFKINSKEGRGTVVTVIIPAGSEPTSHSAR